jgi:C-terminal processing protease CtpA/Prc
MRSLVCVALAAAVAMPALAQPTEKEEAELEAQLEAAREKLEEAAREVAELSGQLTGPIMQDFMYERPSKRAMLGIAMGEADDPKSGVRIESVTPGGPASDAGLKSGDVIVAVDGKNLRNAEKTSGAALVAHMKTLKPGDKVKIEYLRDGKARTAEVTTEVMREYFRRVPPLPHISPLPGVPDVPSVPFTMAFRGPGAQFLDMELVTLTPKLGRYFGTDKGVLVIRVPRSADFKLEEGDVIVDIDGRAPQNGAHALRILRSYQPGEKVTLNVLRDRKAMKLAATMPKDAAGDGEAGAFFFNEPVPFTRKLPAPGDGPT